MGSRPGWLAGGDEPADLSLPRRLISTTDHEGFHTVRPLIMHDSYYFYNSMTPLNGSLGQTTIKLNTQCAHITGDPTQSREVSPIQSSNPSMTH
jgi:hypothetical protein